jgi:NADPH:quinone reductase-like Zn-dependent oxidoreductase
MLAAVLKGLGGPEQLEVRTDIPVPVAAPGEVLVRVRATAINNTDINTRTGWYSTTSNLDTARQAQDSAWTGTAFQFPRIQGADACGIIAGVGEGVAAARVGERVLIDPILRGTTTGMAAAGYLGAERDGAFAEFLTVPAGNAYPVTSEYTDVELASFPCSYLAAENMLSRAALEHDEIVLVTGASGGVGSAVIQLAARRGARVIAVSDAAKAPQLRALGAARVLTREDDLTARLGHESVDAVIDSVGGGRFAQCLQILRRGGRYAVAGAIAGPIVELDLRQLYLKDLRLLGCTIPEPEVFARLLGYIERREIRPLVSASFALRDIHAAQEEFLRKRHVGKIVLVP